MADSPDIVHAKNSYLQCSEASLQHVNEGMHLEYDKLKKFKCCHSAITCYCVLQRLYKSGDSESMHKYTLPTDHPDFIRAKINAQQISDVWNLLCFKKALNVFNK